MNDIDFEVNLRDAVRDLNALLSEAKERDRHPTVGVTSGDKVNVQLRLGYWWTDGKDIKNELR